MDELATAGPPDVGQPLCDIVSAYVSNNHVARADLPALIASVHAALAGMANSTPVEEEALLEQQTPAQIRKSITPNALISFIDGKPYKTLKRHLSSNGFDPYSYRARFGLPEDYPMVALSYSEHRSKLALSLGLGSKDGRAHGSNPSAGKKGQGKKA